VTISELTPELLVMEAAWAPHEGRPPKHLHPSQDEHFELLEGELTAEVDGTTHVLSAGQALDIPAKATHRMWNSGTGQARARWEVRPAQRTAEFFEEMDGGINPAKGAKLLWRYRHEFRLVSSLKG
jgi:hypothetical protein